jgi:extracellular matrix regulatory protein A
VKSTGCIFHPLIFSVQLKKQVPKFFQMTEIKLINIGFGNIVSANRVIAIVSPESAPIKRIITDAREGEKLIDATYGRRTRAVIVMDSGHIVLSAIQPETVANRFLEG